MVIPIEAFFTVEEARGDEVWNGLPDKDLSYYNTEAASESPVMVFSLGRILCKIWRFVLKVVKAIVDGVVDVLITVGKAVITLLTTLVKTVGDGLKTVFGGPLGKAFLWVGLGLGAYLLIGLLLKEDDDD